MRLSHRSLAVSRIFILLGLMLSLTACNLFGGIDSPSGDPQLASKARSAFDQGDFSEALHYYQQLSSNYKDVQTSEEAYLVFNQAGGNIQNFAGAFGDGKSINIGNALSLFATSIKGNTGSANRTAVFNAFQTYTQISDSNIAALVRFIGGMTMCGLVLAEDIPASDNEYRAVDVCPSVGSAPCSNGILAAGALAGSMSAASVSSFNSNSANLSMFNAAMSDVLSAINAIGATGSFGTNTATLATTLTTNGPAAIGATNYRAAMISVNIGL